MKTPVKQMLKSVHALLWLSLSIARTGQAEFIAVGQNNLSTLSYGALLSPSEIIIFPNGTTSNSIPLKASSILVAASINNQDVGLIGGAYAPGPYPGYAALISPSGTVMQLPITGSDSLPSEGTISSTSINDQGYGLIGGQYLISSSNAYAAYVFPSGALYNLPNAGGAGNLPNNGSIASVSLNNQNVGLVGGTDDGTTAAYAAIVNPNGLLINLPNAGGAGNLPNQGTITSVSINSNGAGLIGGFDGSSGAAYAALVSSTGNVSNFPATGGANELPSLGSIVSVSINSLGSGLIGGSDSVANTGYAALISPDGNLTNLPIEEITISGQINSVSINDQGCGLIGGYSSSSPFAALVSPSGIVTPLFPLPSSGIILSVSINNQGIGFIGGKISNTQGFSAIVAPCGILTDCSNLMQLSNTPIFSVANANLEIGFVGSFDNTIQNLLAASFAYESHITIEHKKLRSNRPKNEANISLLASRDNDIPQGSYDVEMPPFSIWISPFGEYIHLSAQHKIVESSNTIGGVITGFDYQMRDSVIGAGLAYSFDYVQYFTNQGHSKINQEMGVLYASFRPNHLFINIALWGGLFQINNERHLFQLITSTSSPHGWVLSPHLEMSGLFHIQQNFILEPFFMLDWANSWQSNYKEHGQSGLNLVLPNLYGSLLRSETGLRFYETIDYCWGRVLFEEKASYINQAPFHFSDIPTYFVGSPSTFGISVGSANVQNLAGIEIHCSFLPHNQKYIYGALDFQGQFGSSYQSYFGALEIGKNF